MFSIIWAFPPICSFILVSGGRALAVTMYLATIPNAKKRCAVLYAINRMSFNLARSFMAAMQHVFYYYNSLQDYLQSDRQF